MRSRVVWGPASLALLLPIALAPLAMSQDLPRGAQRMHFPGDAFSPPQPQVIHLNYYGGPVVSNVVVVQVLWGACDSTVTDNLPTFYGDIVDSPYLDWLCEYNTNVTSYSGTTSNQAIGRGTFGSQVTITPSITTNTISLDQIGAELAAQIDAANLPAPVLDAAGHVNTVYMFHIP